MKPEIKHKEAFTVVGLKIRTHAESNDFPKLWGDYMKRFGELQNFAIGNACVGVTIIDPEAEMCKDMEFEYMAAAIVPDDAPVPEGMVKHKVSASDYAVFTHKGKLDSLAETYEHIYGHWLPHSDYECGEGNEIEWYDERFNPESDDSVMEIYIPVKKKS